MRKIFEKLLCCVLILVIGMTIFEESHVQVSALNEVQYDIYDENGNYAFTYTGSIFSDFIIMEIRSFTASKTGMHSSRIKIYVNGEEADIHMSSDSISDSDIISYSVQYGNGTLQWDGDTDISWYEADKDKYYIHTKEELAGLAYLVNYGEDDFKNKIIKLADDIDLSGEIWVPIGKMDGYGFSGTFDGQDFVISGLDVSVKDDISFYGLFGYITNATVENVNLENINVNANIDDNLADEFFVGSLAGKAVSCNINNIRVNGSMTVNGGSDICVGGMIGRSYSNIIQNIISDIDINSDSFNIGGIIGALNYDRIINAVNLGDICSTNQSSGSTAPRVAGMASWAYDIQLSNFLNYGNITGEQSALKASAVGYVSTVAGKTFTNIYYDDNLNKIEGGSVTDANLVINEDNIRDVLDVLNADKEIWQIENLKLLPKKADVSSYVVSDIGNENNYSISKSKSKEGEYVSVISYNGYGIDGLEIKDSSGNKVIPTKISNSEYRFEMPASAVTVRPTLGLLNFSIGIRANNNYSIKVDGQSVSLSDFTSIKYGETKQIEILPEKGYRIIQVKTMDGRILELVDNKITLSGILDDTNIIVITEKDTSQDIVPVGDNNLVILWIALIVVSGLGIIMLSASGRKRIYQ